MKVFYDGRYTASSHDFDTTRKSADVAELVRGMEGVELTSPREASGREIALVHEPRYVRSVQTGEGGGSSAGLGWDPGMWAMVATTTGGAVDAALTALEEGVAGSLSSGLHHANRGGGLGLCTFNGLALAAKMALGVRPPQVEDPRPTGRLPRRVLILDVDAHCGGGTYDIVADDPRIWLIDISVSPFDGYQVRSERHHLHVIRDAKDYLDILELELERAAEVGFDLVIYNAGMDPHEDCGIGGLPGITSDVIRRREEMVFGWAREHGVPIAFVLAGGYTGLDMWEKRLSALHGMTVAAAAGAEMPDIEAVEADAPERHSFFDMAPELEDGLRAPWADEAEERYPDEPWGEEEDAIAEDFMRSLPSDFFDVDLEML